MLMTRVSPPTAYGLPEFASSVDTSMLSWLTVASLAGLAAALVSGVGIGLAGAWTVLALGPGLVALAARPFLDGTGARVVTVFSWTGAAVLGVAATGGLLSPLVAVFAVGPALAWRIAGGAAAAEATLFASVGLALASVAAGLGAPQADLGVAGPILGLGAIIATLILAAKPMAPPAHAPLPPEAAPPVAAPPENAQGRARRFAELGHELRTPLTHILGFAEVMQHEIYGPLDPRYRSYVDLIHRSGRNLLELLTSLMDVSRIEAGRYQIELERFDVRDLVGEVVRLAGDSAAAKGVVLAMDLPDAPIPVQADPRAIRQILMNLATNAIKFTPQGGRATLRAAAGEGGQVLLEAQDTGPGIPEAERARLGRAFERGQAGQGAEGVGLGLALVRGFAALHGGTLSFHDAPGGGALVRVEAPIGAGLNA